MTLQNKVAIITGASRGIGRAIAEAFVSESRYDLKECLLALISGYVVADVAAIGSRLLSKDRVNLFYVKPIRSFLESI